MSEADKAITEWLERAARELEGAHTAWDQGNAGKGRVCSRRAAGMALKAWLAQTPQPAYGRSFMHHLNALADDEGADIASREAAWRLAARAVPAEGWRAKVPERLTPMHDVEVIEAFCRARLGRPKS